MSFQYAAEFFEERALGCEVDCHALKHTRKSRNSNERVEGQKVALGDTKRTRIIKAIDKRQIRKGDGENSEHRRTRYAYFRKHST